MNAMRVFWHKMLPVTAGGILVAWALILLIGR
jgi:hypothetical protein